MICRAEWRGGPLAALAGISAKPLKSDRSASSKRGAVIARSGICSATRDRQTSVCGRCRPEFRSCVRGHPRAGGGAFASLHGVADPAGPSRAGWGAQRGTPPRPAPTLASREYSPCSIGRLNTAKKRRWKCQELSGDASRPGSCPTATPRSEGQCSPSVAVAVEWVARQARTSAECRIGSDLALAAEQRQVAP